MELPRTQVATERCTQTHVGPDFKVRHEIIQTPIVTAEGKSISPKKLHVPHVWRQSLKK